MGDFAEGLISAIAGGVEGGAGRAESIMKDDREVAQKAELDKIAEDNRLNREKQLAVFRQNLEQDSANKAQQRADQVADEHSNRTTGLINSQKMDAANAQLRTDNIGHFEGAGIPFKDTGEWNVDQYTPETFKDATDNTAPTAIETAQARLDTAKGEKQRKEAQAELTALNKDAVAQQLSAATERRAAASETTAAARATAADAATVRAEAMFNRSLAKDTQDKTPAEVVATKWMIANKDDPVAMEAWDRVHSTKSKDVVNIAADLMARDPNSGTKKEMSVETAISKANALYSGSGKKSFAPNVPTPIAKPWQKYGTK